MLELSFISCDLMIYNIIIHFNSKIQYKALIVYDLGYEHKLNCEARILMLIITLDF